MEHRIRVGYDTSVDIVRVTFADTRVWASGEMRPGVIVDFDATGAVVGVEVLDARGQMPNLQMVEFALAA